MFENTSLFSILLFKKGRKELSLLKKQNRLALDLRDMFQQSEDILKEEESELVMDSVNPNVKNRVILDPVILAQTIFPETVKLKSGFSGNNRAHHYLLSSELLQKLDLELHNYCLLRHQQLQLYKILWRTKCSEMTLGTQSFTSPKADLYQKLRPK